MVVYMKEAVCFGKSGIKSKVIQEMIDLDKPVQKELLDSIDREEIVIYEKV